MTREEAIKKAHDLLREHGVPAVIWVREDLESLVPDFVANEEDYEKVIRHVEDSYNWQSGLVENAVREGWDIISDAFVDAISDLKVDGLL